MTDLMRFQQKLLQKFAIFLKKLECRFVNLEDLQKWLFRMLLNEHLVAKIGVDTAENEPRKE